MFHSGIVGGANGLSKQIVWKYPSTNPNTGHIKMVRDYPRADRGE